MRKSKLKRHKSTDDFWIDAENLWEQNAYRDAMFVVTLALNSIRENSKAADWRAYIEKVRCRTSLFPHLHSGLIAQRSFKKPRGYSGDAILIDYIYGNYSKTEENLFNPLVYTAEYGASSCASVRERKHRIADFIDRYSGSKKPRILSVASGHAREVNVSRLLKCGYFEQFIAFDQDALSLQSVEVDYGHLGLSCFQGNIGRLILSKYELGSFDLIYCAGLYDYLNDATAAKLTEYLVNSLTPDGQLLIANFTPDLPDRGYLEAVADWFLTYRDESGMNKILGSIMPEHNCDVSLFRDSLANIVYLKLTKKNTKQNYG